MRVGTPLPHGAGCLLDGCGECLLLLVGEGEERFQERPSPGGEAVCLGELGCQCCVAPLQHLPLSAAEPLLADAELAADEGHNRFARVAFPHLIRCHIVPANPNAPGKLLLRKTQCLAQFFYAILHFH